MAEWSRMVNTTISEYVKGEEVNILRNRKLLDLAQSKGRTPSVFVFNPFAEGRIAQGKSFTPVKHQAQLAADLATLPMFLGRQDDVVLVKQRPAVEFLSELKQLGFPLPEFVEIQRCAQLAERKLGQLRPWAWGPDSTELLASLFGSLTRETRTAESSFNKHIAALYSKAWSAGFLRRCLAQQATGSGKLAAELALWLSPAEVAGKLIERLRQDGVL